MDIKNKIIISDIVDVITVMAYTGRTAKITEREYYGLTFCKKGKITYSHKNNNYVSVCNSAVILPMGATYTLYNNEGGEFPLINFLCTKPFTEDFLTIPLDFQSDYFADYERLKEYFLRPNGKLKAMSILYDIIYKLFNENSSNNLLTPAMKYISENISDPNLRNSEIAESSHISECYLRKLFLKEFSVTPKQYIIETRISNAKRVLTETNLTVSEISERCGFSSVYHFCRAFKSNTGITPNEYRKHYMMTGI